jgi:hypothetical protein
MLKVEIAGRQGLVRARVAYFCFERGELFGIPKVELVP